MKKIGVKSQLDICLLKNPVLPFLIVNITDVHSDLLQKKDDMKNRVVDEWEGQTKEANLLDELKISEILIFFANCF